MPLSDRHGLGRFILVGGIGFVVDAAILTWLSQTFAWNIFAARAASFGGAVLITWLLNRTFVFSPHRDSNSARGLRRELARYLTVQGGGVLINFAAFAVLIFMFSALARWPVIPLAAASAVALVWNYAGAKLWTFSGVRSGTSHAAALTTESAESPGDQDQLVRTAD